MIDPADLELLTPHERAILDGMENGDGETVMRWFAVSRVEQLLSALIEERKKVKELEGNEPLKLSELTQNDIDGLMQHLANKGLLPTKPERE